MTSTDPHPPQPPGPEIDPPETPGPDIDPAGSPEEMPPFQPVENPDVGPEAT